VADQEAPAGGGHPEYVLQGTNGTLECWPDRIVVRRQGGLARLGTGFAKRSERTLPYDAVQSVEVEWAGRPFHPGYITFTLGGAEPPKRNPAAQRRDEYAVAFRRRDNDTVREMKGYIEAHLRRVTASADDRPDRVDQLERLARLHAEGALSDQEFEAEKQRLG